MSYLVIERVPAFIMQQFLLRKIIDPPLAWKADLYFDTHTVVKEVHQVFDLILFTSPGIVDGFINHKVGFPPAYPYQLFAYRCRDCRLIRFVPETVKDMTDLSTVLYHECPGKAVK